MLLINNILYFFVHNFDLFVLMFIFFVPLFEIQSYCCILFLAPFFWLILWTFEIHQNISFSSSLNNCLKLSLNLIKTVFFVTITKIAWCTFQRTNGQNLVSLGFPTWSTHCYCDAAPCPLLELLLSGFIFHISPGHIFYKICYLVQ